MDAHDMVTSVLPSVGAVNPALTAMANARRVGNHAHAAGLTRGGQ
jgi:choline dehydrogenase-like flavoprotein